MPGKRGNTNAVKHGIYVKHFNEQDIKDLRKMPFDDLRQEIAYLRVSLDRLAALIKNTTDDDAKARYYNVATNTAQAIGTLIRTHSILAGTYTPLDDALERALTEIDPYYTQDDLQP